MTGQWIMSRIVVVILIYSFHRHKPLDPSFNFNFKTPNIHKLSESAAGVLFVAAECSCKLPDVLRVYRSLFANASFVKQQCYI
jgi:hypothetical protein